MHLGCSEDEYDVLWRLLERFQQRVKGRPRQHMHLVYDIHAVAGGGGREGTALAQLANVVNTVIGGGVNFDYIKYGLVINSAANFTFVAGIAILGRQAIDRLCQNFRTACLARAA